MVWIVVLCVLFVSCVFVVVLLNVCLMWCWFDVFLCCFCLFCCDGLSFCCFCLCLRVVVACCLYHVLRYCFMRVVLLSR